jgi:hypothetical protein
MTGADWGVRVERMLSALKYVAPKIRPLAALPSLDKLMEIAYGDSSGFYLRMRHLSAKLRTRALNIGSMTSLRLLV